MRGVAVPPSVLGWQVRDNSPDVVLLTHENPIARTVWVGVIPLHQQVVRQVLRLAAKPDLGGPDPVE